MPPVLEGEAPANFYKNGFFQTSRCFKDTSFNTLDARGSAWISYFIQIDGQVGTLPGNLFWGSNHLQRYNLASSSYIATNYTWNFPIEGGAFCQTVLSEALSPNTPHHVVVTFDGDGGKCRLYVDGFPIGVNTDSGGTGRVLTTSHWLNRFYFGNSNTEADSPSEYRLQDFALGWGGLPTVAQIQQLALRQIDPEDIASCKHWIPFSGVQGVDLATGQVGTSDAISGGGWNIDTFTANRPYHNGPKLVISGIAETITQDLLISRSGRLGFVMLTKTSDGSPVVPNKWNVGGVNSRHLPRTEGSTTVNVPITIKINGGSDITPEWVYVDEDLDNAYQKPTYIIVGFPHSTVITGSDTVTWSADFGWATVEDLGPLGIATNKSAINHAGTHTFEDYLATTNTMKVGGNEAFITYAGTTNLVYNNQMFQAYGLRNPVTNIEYGVDNPIPGEWTCFIGSLIAWRDGQPNIEFQMLPDGEYNIYWDGASASPQITNDINATITEISRSDGNATNNRITVNISRTVTTENRVGWRVIFAGSVGVQNPRFYCPGTNLSDLNNVPLFHPAFLSKLDGREGFRSMDLSFINNNNARTLADWPSPDRICYATDWRIGNVNVVSVTDPGNLSVVTGGYFIPGNGKGFIKITTDAPHQLKTKMVVNIDGGAAKIYFDCDGVPYETPLYQSTRPVYVLSPTEYIMYIGLYQPGSNAVVTGVDPIPANCRTFGFMNGMMPYQHQVQLANTLNKTIHFNLPDNMDVTSYQTLATYFAENCDVPVYLEYKNEAWNVNLLFIQNTQYEESGRVKGINRHQEYADQANAAYEIFRAAYALEGKSNLLKCVFGTMMSVPSVTQQIIDRCESQLFQVDAISPASYSNSSMRYLPLNFKLRYEQVSDIAEVTITKALWSGLNYSDFCRQHLTIAQAYNPDVEMVYYEGGMSCFLVSPIAKPGRSNLAIETHKHSSSRWPHLASLKMMQDAGATFYHPYMISYIDVIETYPGNAEDVVPGNRTYSFKWDQYDIGVGDYGLGNGTDGKYNNDSALTYDVNGDANKSFVARLPMVSVWHKVDIDWNASLGDTPRVEPPSATLQVNQTLNLTAYDFNPSAPSEMDWNPDRGGISVNSGGLSAVYTAPATAGPDTVIVTDDDTPPNTFTVNLTITSVPVNPTISPLNPSVVVNGTIQFSSTGPSGVTPVWSAVLGIVTQSGGYTAPSTPTTSSPDYVRVTYGEVYAETSVVVNPAPQTPTVTPNNVNVYTNAQQQFFANNFPAGSGTWNTNVGSITSLGVFTAQSIPANGIVSYQVGSTTASANVSVIALPAGPSVSPNTATVIQGGVQQFSASNFSPDPDWSVNGSSTVNVAGLFIAEYHAGSTAITRTVTATNGTQTATATVTIPPVVINITPISPTVQINNSIQLQASVQNAINTNGVWSLISGQGSINPSTGVYVASNNAGTAVVRFALQQNSAIYKEVTINVVTQSTTKTVWFGLKARAVTTVTANRNAGTNIIKLASAGMFDGPRALPTNKIILSITRGTSDTPICKLLVSSRNGSDFTIDQVIGPDSNVQIGDFASCRITEQNMFQIHDAINNLEP